MVLLVLVLFMIWLYVTFLWLESVHKLLKWGLRTRRTSSEFIWEDAFGGE